MAGSTDADVDADVGTDVRSSLLSDAWIARVVDASAEPADADLGGHSGVVAVTIGKKQQAVLDIVDGRVVGPGNAEAVAVTVPVTADQLDGYMTGTVSMATDYMRGDVKPVGSTGALLALIELFENPAFRASLAGRSD